MSHKDTKKRVGGRSEEEGSAIYSFLSVLCFFVPLCLCGSTSTLREHRLFQRDADLDLVSLDFHLEGVDLDSRVIAPFAVVNAEPPGVPGAGHDSLLHVAAGQRRAHVRAKVVNREKL